MYGENNEIIFIISVDHSGNQIAFDEGTCMVICKNRS